MALPRIPEPEVMDSDEDALSYDAMDHTGVNQQFVLDLKKNNPPPGTWLDLGTGPAQIPILVCEQFPAVRVVAVDAAAAMLAVARERVAQAHLEQRITLVQADAKSLPWPDGTFTVIFCNSIVHHLGDPRLFFKEIRRLTAPGGLVFLRDLARPEHLQALEQLVFQYTATATAYQRKLFVDSLWASFTVAETESLAEGAQMMGARVALTSDRHWTLVWRC
ncbi:class I SAM-dependent methyltransferase [Anthocerotibacter panamensis]|uniref:class I SAM-dependent methyltransferase n=1 Tax=Anthocerotibacter panamensis TaxID=2857077 RepID=UPI001C404063|nr:class I SAM-dependent methyltransferase [Anthocerotibacter panamensis]